MNVLLAGGVIALGAGVFPANTPVVTEKPDAPVFVDECGYLSDSFSYTDSSSGRFEWRVSLITNPDGSFEEVVLRAVAVDPYEFRTPEKKRTWRFTWTNDAPC